MRDVQKVGGSFALRNAGRCVAVVFRAIPRSRRFAAAVAFARVLEPFIARTETWEQRRLLRTDSLRDTSLNLLLIMLNRHGVRYDPALLIEGEEHLDGHRPHGTLLVGPHAMLGTHITRFLHDRGIASLVISPDPAQPIEGTGLIARVLAPSPWLLVRVRAALQRGEAVVAMIDRGEPERRNVEVQTPAGPMLVSTALLQTAVRQRAAIVFLAGSLEDRRIALRFGVPRHSDDVDSILRDFADFVGRALTSPAAAAPTAGIAARTESALQSADASTASTS